MFSWSFSTHKEHSPSWYVIAIVIVLMLVVYGIVQQLYLMSVVAFLFTGVYLLMENNSAPTTEVNISEQGIHVGGSYYDYINYSRFSMISIGNVPSFIRLYPTKKIAALIDIPLSSEVNPMEIRKFLQSVMEEDSNNTISNADALIHAMKL
ncbi:hypothetical protein K2X92_01705 [Candidatus Gracilibacteria bacterium]|nr:hypothetical protein [Candidatus Gracilibacteria bacterium]